MLASGHIGSIIFIGLVIGRFASNSDFFIAYMICDTIISWKDRKEYHNLWRLLAERIERDTPSCDL